MFEEYMVRFPDGTVIPDMPRDFFYHIAKYKFPNNPFSVIGADSNRPTLLLRADLEPLDVV